MNDQSQIEAKIIHLTPPQRFQVAHQLPKERLAVPTQVSQPSKGEEYKVITTIHSKIWAIRILNGTWLLVTLFLKKCVRIDKNLLVVYVALVLLLLQVFMVISRAEAGSLNSNLLMTIHSNLIADRQHTRIAQTFNHHNRCNARGTASRSSCRKTSISTLPVVRYITEKPALASADVYQFASAQNIDSDGRSRGVLVLFRCRKRTRPLPAAMSGLEQKSMLLTLPSRASSVSIPLSGSGVPQMTTSTVTLT